MGDGLTPEQLENLCRRLAPFGAGAAPPPELEAYCRFYGIEFAACMPQVSHEAGTVRSGDYTLAIHLWRQRDARANLLLLHGYFDHTGLFNKLIAWALSRHCNVLMFDLPGHGLSSGEPAVIDDFGDYSRAIADVLSAVTLPALPMWAMAQSTGGAALIDYARKYFRNDAGSGARNDAWPFAATVLLAPLVRPVAWSRVIAGHMLLGRLVDGIARKFSVNSSDALFLSFLKSDPLQSRRISLRWVGALRRWLRDLSPRDLGVGPALIVQGDADATVDWRYNLPFVAKLFPGSEVELLHGAGHQLANESESFRIEYLGYVERWLAEHGIDLQVPSTNSPLGGTPSFVR